MSEIPYGTNFYRKIASEFDVCPAYFVICGICKHYCFVSRKT